MATFNDSMGKAWDIKLTAPKIADIRTQFDGLDLIDPQNAAYVKLSEDPILCFEVIWHLVRPQSPDMTADEFAERLAGQPAEDALDALVQAIIDFFPQRKRSLLRSLVDTTTAVQDKAVETAMAKIQDPRLLDEMERAMDEQMTHAINNALTRLNSATSSPANSA